MKMVLNLECVSVKFNSIKVLGVKHIPNAQGYNCKK